MKVKDIVIICHDALTGYLSRCISNHTAKTWEESSPRHRDKFQKYILRILTNPQWTPKDEHNERVQNGSRSTQLWHNLNEETQIWLTIPFVLARGLADRLDDLETYTNGTQK